MVAATHAHTSSSGTCSRLLRSDIFSLRLRVPFTFYDRSSGPFLSARFYRPVHTGRGKRVKTIVVERGGGGGRTPKTPPLSAVNLSMSSSGCRDLSPARMRSYTDVDGGTGELDAKYYFRNAIERNPSPRFERRISRRR